MACAAAVFILVLCLLLIVYFVIEAKKTSPPVDVSPHEWFISTKDWLVKPPFNRTEKNTEYNPLRLVIIGHTVGPECTRFDNCAAEMRNLQTYYIQTYKYDLPYNFLIGNDGRVYEGRGWNVIGAHTYGYNSCSMGLAFVGDYREGSPSYAKVTELQLLRAQMLLAQGVSLEYLHPKFQILGAKDLVSTESPGANIYNIIKGWPSYAHDNVFKGKSCKIIKAMFDDKTNDTTTASPTTTPT